MHFISPITHDIRSTYPAPAFIHDLTFSHAGDMLLLASDNGQVMLFDYPSMEQMHIVKAHTAAAQCLSLDSRGAYCAVGGSDAVVGIWDTTDWICLRTVRGLDYPVRSLSFSFDGQYICAGSDESGSHSIDIVGLLRTTVVVVVGLNHWCVVLIGWTTDSYGYRRGRAHVRHEPCRCQRRLAPDQVLTRLLRRPDGHEDPEQLGKVAMVHVKRSSSSSSRGRGRRGRRKLSTRNLYGNMEFRALFNKHASFFVSLCVCVLGS